MSTATTAPQAQAPQHVGATDRSGLGITLGLVGGALLLVSGLLSGLGGAQMSLFTTSTFVRDMNVDRNDAAIVRAVLNLAYSLGIQTVAEGVENESQLAYLRAGGCHFGQGFLFGAALPASRISELQRIDRSRSSN